MNAMPAPMSSQSIPAQAAVATEPHTAITPSHPLAAARRRERIVGRGQSLFSAGTASHTLYLVRSGSIKTCAFNSDGDEQVFGFHFAGDVVGLEALETSCHGCTAIALETSSVWELPRDHLATLCQSTPELQRQLYQCYGREIVRDQALLRLLGKKHAEQRLVGFLLHLSQRFAERGFSAREFNLSMSRSDIGFYLGLALETVSRLFSRLQTKGILSVDRRYVHIIDADRLGGLA